MSAGLRALALGLLAGLAIGVPAAAASYEINVSKDPRARDGEPSLGVNPTDPANLVMGYMKANQGECAVSASFNRGRTWKSQVLGEITDPFYSFCADPTLVFGADGTVYFAAIAFHQSFQVGRVLVTRSADGGRHWTRPVEAVGGSTPPIDGFDRPWLAVDKATGTLYLTTMTIFSRPALPIAHRYLVASHNKGRTWGRARIVDSPRYPADHWATGTIAVGPGGAVGIAYSARGVPEPGIRCPCAVLATTTDGVHFARRTVPLGETLFGISLPEPGQLSALALSPGPTVAADPTRRGDYAVVVAEWKGLVPYVLGESGIGPEVSVRVRLFRTGNSGRSWLGPTLLGEDRAFDREHVWVAYSPTGALGATWRTHTGSCCFDSTDVWAVLSRDGGRRFDRPRRLSHASSPFTGLLGDDYQSVVLDRSFLHTAWGDGRSGNVEAYYGRLALQRRR